MISVNKLEHKSAPEHYERIQDLDSYQFYLILYKIILNPILFFLKTIQHLIKEFFHGVVLPQQVVDLILAVHRGLALTGAAEILGHLTWVVLILFKLPPLSQLHGGECYISVED